MHELLDLTRYLDRADLLRIGRDIESAIRMRLEPDTCDSAVRCHLLRDGIIDDIIRHKELALADFQQRFLRPGLAQYGNHRSVICHGCLDFRPINMLDLFHPVCWHVNHKTHLLYLFSEILGKKQHF